MPAPDRTGPFPFWVPRPFGFCECPTVTDPLVTDGAQGIKDFELHRLHYANSMIDLWTFGEDYRYVFRNGGGSDHRVAPLLWRWRMVQANMYVLDAENKNLVYLPSRIAR